MKVNRFEMPQRVLDASLTWMQSGVRFHPSKLEGFVRSMLPQFAKPIAQRLVEKHYKAGELMVSQYHTFQWMTEADRAQIEKGVNELQEQALAWMRKQQSPFTFRQLFDYLCQDRQRFAEEENYLAGTIADRLIAAFQKEGLIVRAFRDGLGFLHYQAVTESRKAG